MPKVLITREIPRAGISILNQYRELEIDYRQGPPLTDKKLKEAIKGTDAVVAVIPDSITKDVIKSAGKNLKIIAAYSVGYDNIDVDFATQKKIFVTNTPGDLTEAVGEHCVAMMLSLGRKIAASDRFCRDKKYKFWDPMAFVGQKFMGKTLGIIGFGRIGQFFARIAKNGFDMNILYYDIVRHPEAESLIDAKKVDLDFLLSNSDVVSLNCNLTEETHHMIAEAQFKKMKPLALIINTARGSVINEKALIEALKEGTIAGAALDVYENEPKIDSELLSMDNVVLTSHIASATWEARIQMARMVAESVIDVLINKKTPRYLVNTNLAKETIKSLV